MLTIRPKTEKIQEACQPVRVGLGNAPSELVEERRNDPEFDKLVTDEGVAVGIHVATDIDPKPTKKQQIQYEKHPEIEGGHKAALAMEQLGCIACTSSGVCPAEDFFQSETEKGSWLERINSDLNLFSHWLRLQEQIKTRSNENTKLDINKASYLQSKFREAISERSKDPSQRDAYIADAKYLLDKTERKKKTNYLTQKFFEFINGVVVEQTIYELANEVCSKNGWDIRFASREEDTNEGTDIIISTPNKPTGHKIVRIDAKSAGQFNRMLEEDAVEEKVGKHEYMGIKKNSQNKQVLVTSVGQGRAAVNDTTDQGIPSFILREENAKKLREDLQGFIESQFETS